MALIEVRGVGTVFGSRPAKALQLVREGIDKATLLERHGHVLALHDVNLDIGRGEIFVVMGLSGSGKSTLLRHINRLIEPSTGQVRVDGADVAAMDTVQLLRLRRERVAMVFQRFALLPHRNVIDNVALGLGLRGVPKPQRDSQARHWIERVGLAGHERQMPAQLSGGMQQRVGLARALCAGTDIILMDEAFSALDPLIRTGLQAQLLELQAETGRTVVFVTHDLDEALRLGHRLAILHEGRVLQVGTPDQLLTQPADEHVAAFVQGVNRARAWHIGAALAPWPPDLAQPPIDEAVDDTLTIEQVLPRLLGRSEALAVRRGGRIAGRVDVDKLRRMLDQRGR